MAANRPEGGTDRVGGGDGQGGGVTDGVGADLTRLLPRMAWVLLQRPLE